MSTPLTVTIPHGLSRAEARARVAGNFDRVAEMAKPYVSTVEERWENDVLNVSVGAIGRTFSGRVEPLDEVVKIEVDMPPMFGWLKGRVRKVLTKHGPRLLAKPEAMRGAKRA